MCTWVLAVLFTLYLPVTNTAMDRSSLIFWDKLYFSPGKCPWCMTEDVDMRANQCSDHSTPEGQCESLLTHPMSAWRIMPTLDDKYTHFNTPLLYLLPQTVSPHADSYCVVSVQLLKSIRTCWMRYPSRVSVCTDWVQLSSGLAGIGRAAQSGCVTVIEEV